MRHHAGILDGNPTWDPVEVLILAYTPGVPLEWIYAALGLGWMRRRRLRDMIHAAKSGEFPSLGQENAATVEQGDGWRMIAAVCPGYAGPAPLWTQIELRNSARSDAANAALLGVDRQKVRRWRVNTIFDPLTGVRVRANRGVPL